MLPILGAFLTTIQASIAVAIGFVRGDAPPLVQIGSRIVLGV
jgi:hypothetical protein